MKPTHSRWVGTAVIAATGLVLGTLIAEGASRSAPIGEIPPLGEYMRILTVYGVYGLIGGLLLRHSVRNPIGILVAVMGLVPLVGNLAEVVLARGSGSSLVLDSAVWIVNWYFYAFFGAFLPLFHLLPTGVVMGGWWKWWARIAIFGYGLLVFMFMFGPPEECPTCIGVNPLAIPAVSAAAPVLLIVMGIALVVGLATGVVSLGVRYRRSRGVVRAQLKWVFFGVVTSVALFFGVATITEELGLPEAFGQSVAGVAFILPAVGILLAVTRHGLFEIDRLVNRTVTYAATGVVIAAVYAIPVVVLPEALGLSSDLSVAAATLAAAAMFTPLRRRVQSVVARRFDRERYDAERVLAGVAARLQAIADSAAVSLELGSAVAAALRPRSVGIWLRTLDSVTVAERAGGIIEP